MGLILCLLFFGLSLSLTLRRVGHGLGFVLIVGCVYGWLRCYFLDGFTHFSFDTSLLGLYLGVIPRIRSRELTGASRLRQWGIILMSWPLFVILCSPFLEAQPILIQFVGLRNALLFVPAIFVGAILTPDEVDVVGGWCIAIVFIASAFAAVEFLLGLEAVFPMNSASRLIYQSRDIAGDEYRIPASFSSAHAYGGTMISLLPFLLHRLGSKRRYHSVTLAALIVGSLGTFICGARTPVIGLFVMTAVAVWALRRRPGSILVLVGAAAVVTLLVRQTERFQRFESLSDQEMVEERVSGSVNQSFFEVLSNYPLGKGLGAAAGTSIPYFLEEFSIPQVGIENEYGRLAVEEGLIGLLLWVGFTLWALVRLPSGLRRFGGVTDRALWALCWFTWGTALIGTGILAAIPSGLILLLAMGMIASQPRASASARVVHSFSWKIA